MTSDRYYVQVDGGLAYVLDRLRSHEQVSAFEDEESALVGAQIMNVDEDERPKHWIIVNNARDREHLDRYLGFGAVIEQEGVNQRGAYLALVSIPPEHAEWLRARLHSGLMGPSLIYVDRHDALPAFHLAECLP